MVAKIFTDAEIARAPEPFASRFVVMTRSFVVQDLARGHAERFESYLWILSRFRGDFA
jgi:hypothetical protein